MPEARPPIRAKVAAIVGVALMLLAARHLGIFQRFAEPSLLVKALVELGPRGYLAFVAAYAVLQPFGVPETIPLSLPDADVYGMAYASALVTVRQ